MKYIIGKLYSIWTVILTIIGDIRISKYIPFLYYNPDEYDFKVRGGQIDTIRAVIKPGDIVLRKYNDYLDSLFIPGAYSHTGIYVGDDTIIHAVAEGVKKIHITDYCQADGICVLRATSLSDNDIEDVVNTAKSYLGAPYDFSFSGNNKALYCHELGAMCFIRKFSIQSYPITLLGEPIEFLGRKYLAESFLFNPNFQIIITTDEMIR